MSAVASRSQDEVAANRNSELLPTFFEAMGEKDANVAGDASASGSSQGPGQGSRTQLWKPGRSWWEAKSGKNPWVEPVVHNNRWRYLWPLIHYHKFIAKCIKKLKRNSIDVKHCTSGVSLFLRQEVCNVSDHLAFMSKYDSEEWTAALSRFDGWTDHDPTVEETLRTLVASQRLAGVADTVDAHSSLLRSQIDDKILKAMQTAKEEAGRDQYDYIPKEDVTAATRGSNYSMDTSLGGRTWVNETHLRSAIESKKRTINDTSRNTSRSDRSGYHHGHPPPYPPQDVYGNHHGHHQGHPPPPHYGPPPPGYGQPYGGHPANPHYYPPPHPHPHPQYNQSYHGQGYPPHHPMGYHHHQGDMSYNVHYHQHQHYDNGYYQQPSADGSFHEGMVFDNSMHALDPYYDPHVGARTPNRGYQGMGDPHHHGQYPPASPYWEHLHLSQLPGIAASPNVHVTPSKPPRNPDRSYRNNKGPQHSQGGRRGKPPIDGKAKSLIVYNHQTNSPASRFVMSPQDRTSAYYATEDSRGPSAASNNNAESSSNRGAAQPPVEEESFVLPTIEDYSPESPADRAAGRSLRSDTSMDLMPPAVKKMYMSGSSGGRRQDGTLTEVSENP